MKRCPQCNRVETDDSLLFCRADGTPLVAESGAAEEAATRTLPPPDSTSERESRTTGPTTALASEHKQSAPRSTARPRSLKASIVVAIAIGIVLAVAAYFYTKRVKSVATGNSIAVLPFVNASGDATMEYLSDGISESLINGLSQLPNMRVMARSTSFSFKGKDSDPSAIGKQLGVNAVLTGKIVQLGDNLGVQVDLVNVSDGSQLWGERYNRKSTDLLSLQEEIAREVVEKLRVRLSNEDRDRLAKRYTANIDAYRTYLKGRYEWNKRTGDGLKRSIEYFNEAIALDPAYALAYAGVADAYALLPQFANAPFDESLMKAKAASLKALELDNSLAEAHISLASVKQSLWDWKDVESEYKRGLELNPNYATGHQWYSEYLIPVGRLAEAQTEIRRAQELDPLSLVINVRVGMTAYFSRQFALAAKQLKDALQFNPEFVLTNIFLFNTLYQEQKIEESIPYLVTGVFNGYSKEERARFESEIRNAYSKSGEKGMFERVRGLLKTSQRQDYSYAVLMGMTLVHLGELDEAFVWLNRAADLKHPSIPTLRVDPVFDGIRSDPRFEELVKRVGI
ncbi:MAG TPA: hypothetical protein VGW58_07910 [Pyrinomonadaceae bacterium]|nr:hypothetical protein [Pyrinomonadaceae bacterium]